MKKEISRKQEDLQEMMLGIIESIQGISIMEENPILKEELYLLKKRAQDQFFKVAVVGEFSSGKSTFINALIGKDLLKHGAKETTATLTKIINVDEKHALLNKGKVVFRNGNEKILDSLDEITDYTTTSSESHRVSQEIDTFEIYIHFLDTDIPVMIIDTPGLNGMAENHREQTILQLKEAHACIYLMQLRGLSQSDTDFIRFIMNYQHDFIFLQNFIDELKELEGETVKSKLQKQSEILKKDVFYDQKAIRYELCGISSRNALLARDESYDHVSEFSEGSLDEIARRKLLKSSNFDQVMNLLKTLMNDNHKGLVQQRSVMENLVQFLLYAQGLLRVEEETQSALWQESDEEKMLKKTIFMRDRLLEQQKDHEKKLEHFVYAKVHELSQFTRKRIALELQNLEIDISTRIRELPSIELLENFIDSHEIEKCFGKRIPSVEKAYMEFLEAGFQDIMSNAVLRIHEYTRGAGVHKEIPGFHIQKSSHEIQRFSQEEDNLKKINREIAELMAEDKKMSLEMLIIRKEKDKAARASEKLKKDSEMVKAEHDRKVKNNGSEPPKEMKKIMKSAYESHRESHRIFGRLLDFMLGEKQVQVPEYVEVNTKRNQWHEEKRKLETEFSNGQKDLEDQLAELEIRMSGYKNKTDMLEKSKEVKTKRMESLEKLYTSTRDTLETKKKVAMTEYMNLIRKALYERIYGYLYEEENIQAYFEEHATEYIRVHRDKLLTKVLSFYEAALKERVKRYEALMKGMPKKERSDCEKERIMIEKYRNELEEYLCQIL